MTPKSPPNKRTIKQQIGELKENAKTNPLLTTLVFVLFIATCIVLYWALFADISPEWTGFGAYDEEVSGPRSKTLWDWLELLIVPAVLALAALLFNRSQKITELKIATDAREAERKLSESRQMQAVLEAYFDKMTDLLLSHDLRGVEQGAEEISIATARTIAVVRSLDATRNRDLLAFLQGAKLVGGATPRIDFTMADLSGANLSGANLTAVNLHKASLWGTKLNTANLSQANLSGAELSGAEIKYADLRRANVSGAHLFGVHLDGTKLIGADLSNTELGRIKLIYTVGEGTDFSNAKLFDAELEGADLNSANLNGAHFVGASLKGVNLSHADLSNAILVRANMRDDRAMHGSFGWGDSRLKVDNEWLELIRPTRVNMSGANIQNANLQGADMTRVDLSHVKGWSIRQLEQAKTLTGAIMPDGTQTREKLLFGIKAPTFKSWKAQYLATHGGTETDLRDPL